MRRLALACLLALAACERPPLPDRRGDAPGYAEAALAPYPGTKIRYYLAEGVTAAELNESMRERNLGGNAHGGRFAVGLTEWTAHWRWPGRSDGGCDLSKLQLDFDVTVTLPQLANENASPEIKRQWGNFVADVVAHEVGHVKLIHEHQDRIIAAIHAADCETAEAAANAALAELTAANARYDAEADRKSEGGATFSG
jgi:predicted secreted Zn-dependent protease